MTFPSGKEVQLERLVALLVADNATLRGNLAAVQRTLAETQRDLADALHAQCAADTDRDHPLARYYPDPATVIDIEEEDVVPCSTKPSAQPSATPPSATPGPCSSSSPPSSSPPS